MKPFIVDSQMVGHLVEDGLTDLGGKPFRAPGETQVFFPEDADAVRNGGVIVHPAVFEHHTFVEAEEASPMLRLGRGGPILYDDVEVVDAFDDPLRKLIEDAVDDALKGGEIALDGQVGV